MNNKSMITNDDKSKTKHYEIIINIIIKNQKWKPEILFQIKNQKNQLHDNQKTSIRKLNDTIEVKSNNANQINKSLNQ